MLLFVNKLKQVGIFIRKGKGKNQTWNQIGFEFAKNKTKSRNTVSWRIVLG